MKLFFFFFLRMYFDYLLILTASKRGLNFYGYFMVKIGKRRIFLKFPLGISV